ncbi:gephyrin-like molybdotransferase Glp [Janthinobacterium sp.]|uniref:molybdopterin molybdotransferase MoeA n=1 Tax=Janthinobacterium sp. TaxID=1871054 RepID=UPI00289BF2D6|nr:gephyrin-like molybdotransferase Glp [Janthinobacterium sp.]
MADTAERKPMLSVAEALALMSSACRPLTEVELVDTMQVNGRVLAAAQTSTLNVPERDNTQMDGYAVRAADCASGAASLPVSQRIAAGHVGQPLQPGTAARIFTGALIPEGADCVVMQEQCTLIDGVVTINHVPHAGEWVRRQGEDIRAGGVILEAGRRLRSQEMGLAASVGLAQLPVLRRLRVAMFSTGDELAMPGQPLLPGAVYNSNRFTLRGLLENLGCFITDLGIVPDTLEATRAVLRQAADGHDLILTSGGVSVGEEDHIKPAVEAEGRLNLWQIAVKPGKPLAFGEVQEAFFIGLPGNPVSSFVTFLLFVRPFILRLQGVTGSVAPRSYRLAAAFERVKADRRNEFLRARVNGDGELELFANQSSGVLTSTVWGDGLIDCPPGLSIARGDMLRFIPFNELLY